MNLQGKRFLTHVGRIVTLAVICGFVYLLRQRMEGNKVSLEDFAAANQIIIESVTSNIFEVLDSGYGRARCAAGPASQRFGNFSEFRDLVWAALCDKLNGGDRVNVLIANAYGESVFSPMGDASGKMVLLYRDAIGELEKRGRRRYGEEFTLPDVCNVTNVVKVVNADENSDVVFNADAIKSLSADLLAMGGLDVASRQIAKRGAYQIIGASLKNLLLKLSAKPVARFVASSTAAAITSQLDSPAPGPADAVAVVIEVGGVAWTTYDIYQAKQNAPGTLSSAISTAVVQTKEQFKTNIVRGFSAAREALANGGN